MSIQKLIIKNFKGIKNREEFEVRPITIFCGPNSSGKSSCIHALAALAQTTKLSASQMPIVLDDEYAHVHLGRFMDVIHSKDAKDSFSIGVRIEKPVELISILKSDDKLDEHLQAEYSFKAKASTQEIYIQSAVMEIGGDSRNFERLKNSDASFSVHKSGKKMPFTATAAGRFSIQVRPTFENGKSNPDEMETFFLAENVSRNLNSALRHTFYLGPFRQGPLRKYPTRGSQPSEVGAAGEAAVTMLANEFARSKTKHPNLAQVSTWISKLGLGQKLTVLPVAKTDLVDVSVTLSDGAELSLPDLGFGVSQVLPVLVQCAFAPKDSTLLFEQPELHLHDGAARHLASVFVDVVKSKKSQIIAETHSRHLFHELIQEVRAGRISADDIVLYDVSRKDGASHFRKVTIEVDENGYCEVNHPWGRGLEQ